MQKLTVEQIHFRASFSKHFQRECHVFSSQTSPQSRDKSQNRGERRKRLQGCRSDSLGAEQEVTQEGWSSAPRSCSQAAGCDTQDRRPRPSRPNWSPERRPEGGTSPSPSRSAQTLCSYSPPSSWKHTRDTQWIKQADISCCNWTFQDVNQVEQDVKMKTQQWFIHMLKNNLKHVHQTSNRQVLCVQVS